MNILNKQNNMLLAQNGFSLLELMISIPLGLLVMLAVLQTFTSGLDGVYLQNAYSRVQENGRMASELMARDIRGADYWGCAGDIDAITSHLDSSDSDYNAALLPVGGAGVDGENDVTSQSIAAINVKDSTDTLTLRGSESLSGVKVSTPYMVTTSANIHITVGSSLEKGDVILVSDCQEADLFTNTIQNTATSGNIGHNTGSIQVDGAIDNATQILSHTYSAGAQILAPFAKIYFIGENASGSHSLYRSDNGTAQELVRGINDLQLIYGEDTNDDGSVDTFANADSVSNMDDVLSIRISLVAESGEGSSGTALEKTYDVTGNIRNRTLQ